MLNAIPLDRQKIIDFCRRWKIVRMAFFGSVLREDFRPDSDVDVMLAYARDIDWFAYDYLSMKEEMERLFQRKVDLIEEGMIRNPVKRRCIYQNLEVIYESGR